MIILFFRKLNETSDLVIIKTNLFEVEYVYKWKLQIHHTQAGCERLEVNTFV